MTNDGWDENKKFVLEKQGDLSKKLDIVMEQNAEQTKQISEVRQYQIEDMSRQKDVCVGNFASKFSVNTGQAIIGVVLAAIITVMGVNHDKFFELIHKNTNDIKTTTIQIEENKKEIKATKEMALQNREKMSQLIQLFIKNKDDLEVSQYRFKLETGEAVEQLWLKKKDKKG